MILREAQRTLRALAAGFPIVSVTGPRQSGKTVLVKATFPKLPYVSLEDPDARELVEADPRGFFAAVKAAVLAAGGRAAASASKLARALGY